MEVLEKLFGNAAKVKVMRMFLINPGASYDAAEIADRMKLRPAEARREATNLEKIGFLRRRAYTKEVLRKRGKKAVVTKRKTQGWTLEPKFPYISLLQSFLIDTNLIRHRDIRHKLQSCGKVKLVVLAGVFIHDPESRVDLLIVGDSIKKGQLENAIRTIESQVGKEVRYTAFETQDFNYRLAMCDKLVRDILDYPHEKVIDKIGLAAV